MGRQYFVVAPHHPTPPRQPASLLVVRLAQLLPNAWSVSRWKKKMFCVWSLTLLARLETAKCLCLSTRAQDSNRVKGKENRRVVYDFFRDVASERSRQVFKQEHPPRRPCQAKKTFQVNRGDKEQRDAVYFYLLNSGCVFFAKCIKKIVITQGLDLC